jgi:hypothetical protein
MGKKGQKKDPNGPKGARNAPNFFYSDFCKEVKGLPGVNATGRLKFSSGVWNILDKDDREKYKHMAEQDLTRYNDEMILYKGWFYEKHDFFNQSFSAGNFIRDHGLDGKKLSIDDQFVARKILVCPIDLYECGANNMLKHVKCSHFPSHKTDAGVLRLSDAFIRAIQR